MFSAASHEWPSPSDRNVRLAPLSCIWALFVFIGDCAAIIDLPDLSSGQSGTARKADQNLLRIGTCVYGGDVPAVSMSDIFPCSHHNTLVSRHFAGMEIAGCRTDEVSIQEFHRQTARTD